MTMYRHKDKKFSMIQNNIQPSSSCDFSGRERYDETKFDVVKRGKDMNLVGIDCDRSTPGTLQSDSTKSSVGYDEQVSDTSRSKHESNELGVNTESKDDNEVTARYANARLVKLYEHGRQKVINGRERQLSVTENRDGGSEVKVIAGYANMRQIQLYQLGKERVTKGRSIIHEAKEAQKNAGYATARLSELHNLGKQKIIKSRDKELKKKIKVRHTELSAEDLYALRANSCQIRLYESSRQNIKSRDNELKMKMKAMHNVLSAEDLAALRANRCQIELYKFGKQKIINQRLNAKRQKEKHALFSCQLPPQFDKQ